MRLLGAELRKMTYQRAMWGMVIAGALFSVLGTASTPFILASSGDGLGFGTLAEQNVVDTVYANAVSGYIFAMLLGVLVVAGEFRHGTAVATFVAAPKRGRVLLAKMVAAGIAGLALQSVATATGLLSGYIALLFYPDAARASPEIFYQHRPVRSCLRCCAGNSRSRHWGLAAIPSARLDGCSVVALCSRTHHVVALSSDWEILPDRTCHSNCGAGCGVGGRQLHDRFLPQPAHRGIVLLGYAVVFAILALVSSMRRDID